MDAIIKKYCPKLDFKSYDELKKNFTINVPEDFNFAFDVVDEWARIEPEKPALVWTDDDGNIERFTFSQVSRESARAANYLKSKGVCKGDVVLLILRQRPEAWFFILALHKIGATVIPGSFQLTKHDLVYRINSASVKGIVTVDEEQVVRHVRESLPECKSIEFYATVGATDIDGAENYRKICGGFSDVFPRPTGKDATRVTDTMLMYFSSGTTGMPKMVIHDYSSPLGQITTARFWQCVQENKIHLTQTDSGWAKFAWGKIYGQWICGATIGAFDTEKFTPKGMIDAIERLRPATFCAPATIYRFLIKEDLTKYDFSFIEHASLAGEPLNPEVFRQIQNMTGLTIHEGYGQTESSVLLANFLDTEIRPGSMGKPAPIYDIDILDEHGNHCEDGVVGSICVKGVDKIHPVGLFREYRYDDEAMKKSFKFGAYNTGDTAWRDADGYYWFVGRNDDVIKCSGYRIGPFEVESALMEHPGVLECAVTAYPDPVRGEVVKATIVLARGYTASDELKKELQDHVKKATAPYKYPRVVEFVPDLPKTTSGKIMRTQIRANDLQKIKAQNK